MFDEFGPTTKGVGVELGWASPKCTIKYKYHIHISHLLMNTHI